MARKAFTKSDLDIALGGYNRVLKRHDTELKRYDGKRGAIVIKAHYQKGSKKKTMTIAEGFSAKESSMIAHAFKDGFKFYSTKTK